MDENNKISLSPQLSTSTNMDSLNDFDFDDTSLPGSPKSTILESRGSKINKIAQSLMDKKAMDNQDTCALSLDFQTDENNGFRDFYYVTELPQRAMYNPPPPAAAYVPSFPTYQNPCNYYPIQHCQLPLSMESIRGQCFTHSRDLRAPGPYKCTISPTSSKPQHIDRPMKSDHTQENVRFFLFIKNISTFVC